MQLDSTIPSKIQRNLVFDVSSHFAFIHALNFPIKCPKNGYETEAGHLIKEATNPKKEQKQNKINGETNNNGSTCVMCLVVDAAYCLHTCTLISMVVTHSAQKLIVPCIGWATVNVHIYMICYVNNSKYLALLVTKTGYRIAFIRLHIDVRSFRFIFATL